MAEYIYKIETIEDYADDEATEAALNAEGQDGWDVVDITYSPNKKGKSTATIIFEKEV